MSNGNNLFKALCSVMIERPDQCGGVSIEDQYDPEGFYADTNSTKYQEQKAKIMKEQEIRVQEYDNNLEGLESRAQLSAILMGLGIVLFVTLACFWYNNRYG